MSYVNPIWLEAQRQRWQRHDAHRFVKPEPVQRKTYAERLVEQRRTRDEALKAAEQDSLRESLLSVRRELAELKFELAFRSILHKYNPNQPRVPKGDPKGGQWEKEGGSEAGKDQNDPDDSNLITKPAAMRGRFDKRPVPVHVPLGNTVKPGTNAQRTTIINNAQTGLSNVDEATEKLRSTLEDVVNELPAGSESSYGTRVHTDFANAVREQNLRGIGSSGVEQTFPRGQPYGSADSVRTDVVLRDDGGEPIAIYDVKTGGARLRAGRVQELLTKAEANPTIPVIEMHVIHGLSLKADVGSSGDRWIIVLRVWSPELPDIESLVEGQAPF